MNDTEEERLAEEWIQEHSTRGAMNRLNIAVERLFISLGDALGVTWVVEWIDKRLRK